ncbi:MAG TPA: hypothetical protein PKY77_23555 [Phycisphaerae bacterium]|nr:hypothetical protein [Phycisphaerae bacterium]
MVGKGGLGKTHEYEQALEGGPYHQFRGRVSGFDMFLQVQEYPDWPIVFDDVKRLMVDPEAVDIMKQLAETTRERTIRWNTTALEDAQKEFVCTSRILVVLNALPTCNPDIEAILDRFDTIEFSPTKAEVIGRMRSFAENQADVDLIATLPVVPSLRTLVKYQDWKRSELDPVEELLAECGVSDEVVAIMSIMEHFPQRQWIKQYQTVTGKNYEAAKRDWTRKRATAAQLVEAAAKSKTLVTCPNVPATSPPPDVADGTLGHPEGGSVDSAMTQEAGIRTQAATARSSAAAELPWGDQYAGQQNETGRSQGEEDSDFAPSRRLLRDAADSIEFKSNQELIAESLRQRSCKLRQVRPPAARKTAAHKMQRRLRTALRTLEEVAELPRNGMLEDAPFDRAGPLRCIHDDTLAMARVAQRLSEHLQPLLAESETAAKESRDLCEARKQQIREEEDAALKHLLELRSGTCVNQTPAAGNDSDSDDWEYTPDDAARAKTTWLDALLAESRDAVADPSEGRP